MEEQSDVRPQPRRRWLIAGCLVILIVACVATGSVLLLNRLAPGGERVGQEADEPEESPAPATATATARATSAPAEAAAVEASAGGAGRIAFVDPLGRLGTVAPDGSDERLLTGDGALFLFPAWSPDGTRLAAVGQVDDGPGVFAVEDAIEAEVTPLFVNRTNVPIYLYWSPAGDVVSFITNHEEGIALYLAPADGSEEARLLATGAPFYWHWRPSGDELLMHTGAAASDARLAFVGAEDGEAGEDLARPGFFQAPGISANGRYLAWAEVDGGVRWLVVRPEEGDGGERLPHRGAVAMGWSPNPESAKLAFISPVGTDERPVLGFQGPLRVLDAESGEVDVLSPHSVLAFFWSPEGSQIAYLTLAGEEDGMQVAGWRGPLARRSKGAAQRNGLQLTLWVADVASGRSTQLLTFRPTPIYLTQFLPFFDQYALSHRVWSPDGTALVLPVAGDGSAGEGIYVVPVNGDGARRVTDGDIAFWGGGQ